MEIQKKDHKLNTLIGGLIDTILPAPRCPNCKQEISRLDYNPEYKATFCQTCYDWVPFADELHIACDLSKPCPKCESDMFAIEEKWEKCEVVGEIWCYSPHRWGCVCGHEEPYKKDSK